MEKTSLNLEQVYEIGTTWSPYHCINLAALCCKVVFYVVKSFHHINGSIPGENHIQGILKVHIPRT